MPKKYQVAVNQQFSFQIGDEELQNWDVSPLGQNGYHVIRKNENFEVKFIQSDFLSKKYEVVINQNAYTIQIQDELDALIQKMGIRTDRTKIITTLKAPMPGLILDIKVKTGQEVQENETLLILEAMKMENTFQSPRQGIIKSIHVTKGQAIDKGQTLIEFE